MSATNAAAPPDRRGIIAEALRKIDDLSARLEVAEKGDTEPIAVVGMGCRLPGGVNNPAEYWRLLQDGASGVVRVPAERWDADAFYSADHTVPGTICSREGGFLSSWQPDEFDAEFFGMSPREAAGMDPQQRLLLEVAWEALENAGITAQAIRGSHTSVFVGMTTNDYYYLAFPGQARPEDVDPYITFGNASNFAAGRLSYFLGVHGPAVVLDTACSSSLVTVHLACQSLRRRESDQALAAGVNLILSPENSIACSRWGMLAPDGRCKTFDADANGYVRSEGAGVVVLKRLGDALRDGDPVWAVVRGSAVNQDGPSSGQTVPNGPAQQAVLRQALAASRLQPADIDYIEAHGTGTALGDPIELDALSQVFAQRDDSAPLVLGSVKTNLGHLESAAGIAGFIKTVLSVRHGHIPQHLNFSALTPHASAGASRFTIAAQPMAWPAVGRARRAGVSSFGVSGTNAHVVVEQAPATDPVPDVGSPQPVVSTLVISGKTPARVASTAAMLAQWMTGQGAGVPLADVAHTINHHRTRHKTFAAVCARDRTQAITGLQALAAGHTTDGVLDAHQETRGSGTVFVYSGQGSQWAGMGQKLLADEPAFAAAVAELEPVFIEQAGFSLRQVLESGQPVVGIDRIQPVLVGMQLALTALWRSYGVQPDAVIGHSMGEVTAAVVAGALTPADGLKVIATRSRLMSRLAGQGAMALLELDATAAEKLIAEYPDLTVAVYAAPGQTVIAGPPEHVDAAIAVVDAQGRLARRIEVDVASHHPTIDPILPELRSALADLAPMTPKIPLISTVGQTNGVAPTFDADYWALNLRNPVRFSQAVATAGVNHSTFIEVTPHPLLTHAVTESLEPLAPRGDIQVAATLHRDNPEAITFHTYLATVAPPSAAIAEIASATERVVDVPPTAWLHSRYWVAPSSAGRQVAGAHPLLGMHVEMPSGRDHVWQADVGTELIPWLADHKVHGQPVMPATGFAEIALAAASEALGLPVQAVAVNRVEVEQMLRLDDRTELTTQLLRGTADSVDDIRVEIHSRSATGNWSRHAVARVAVAQSEAPTEPTKSTGAGTVLSPADLYAALRRTGLHHGQAFAALTRIVRKPGGFSEAEIVLPDEATPHRSYRIHPVMLDAALQCLAAALPAESLTGSVEATYLPVSVETIRVFGDVGRRARCHAELLNHDGDGTGILGRVILMDEAGTPTAELTGIYLQRVQLRSVPLPLTQKIFDTTWVDTSIPTSEPPAPPEGSWLVLTDDAETQEIAEDFIIRFGSPTRRMIRADISRESAVLEAFAKTAADPQLPPVGVVVFAGQSSFDGADSDDAPARSRDLVWAISATVRALIGGWHGKSPRLWLVARDGLAVNGDELGDPAIGALKGLVRVLAYEHPDLRATLVDLATTDDTLAPLMTELGLPSSDDVIAWREGRRYVERLSRAALGAGNRDHLVRRDGAYIVTGGLGGIGLLVAAWLVDSGAGRVVLNGRSEPSDEQRTVLADLEERAQIATVQGDISAPEVAARLVRAAEETGLALRGVVHGAAVIDDQIVAALSRESLERVWAPKAAGALRLHAATAGRELDWWVGFSSTSSLLGSPGQAAYACASAWLDALVAWRRASGLPATTINWGQWSDIGVARSLTFSALDPIAPAEGIEALEAVLAGGFSRVGVARLRLDRAAAAFPEIQQLGYFAILAEELDVDSDDDDWAGPDALRDMDAVEANRVVSTRLGARILAIMGYPKNCPIDANQPLTELGMDSLMAVRIRNTVRGDFGVEPPVALLLQGASLTDLTADLIRQLGLSGQDNAESSDGVRDRAQQRAAARQRAATRRKVGDRV